MSQRIIRIALASLRHSITIDGGMKKVEDVLRHVASKGVNIICFPETYIPGLRVPSCEYLLPDPCKEAQEDALKTVCTMARIHGVAVIIGMERSTDNGLLNVAYVITSKGRLLGYQTKNQITPDGEDKYYVPDGRRRIFDLDGVRIGVVICHEGWRYPETVRWAAVRGAKIVFQPQATGSDQKGKRRRKWGESFYEKAMVCRAQENSIYFASVNSAMRFQNSATSLINPSGECVAYVPYGREGVLVHDINLSKATRFFAKRYNPKWYPE